MSHGTRACYQAGCACIPCRAAEASYRAQLRRRHVEGRPILGRLVDAVPLWRQVRSLQIEGYRKSQIARLANLPEPRIRLHRKRVRLSSRLKVNRLYRLTISEGLEAL